MPPLALIISSNHTRMERIREELAAVGWRASPGQGAQDALRQLQETQVTAVFCDSVLRGASAAGFLAWTRREKPQAHFFLFGDPLDWRGKLKPDGFLSWPPIRSELPVAPGTIVPTEAELARDDVPLSGNTGLMSLPQLLDMLRFSKRDAVVRLHGDRGYVYLQGGVVLHASYHHSGTMQVGMAALAGLIAMDDTDFVVEEFERPGRATINLPVAGAVSEAARLADERRRDQALVAALLEQQPRLSAIAVGYHLAQQPDVGHGDSERLFAQSVALLASHRNSIGAPAQSLCFSSERYSIALHEVSETRFVAVAVNDRVGAALLRLVEKAVAAMSEPASAS